VTGLLFVLLFSCRIFNISVSDRAFDVACQIPARDRVHVFFKEEYAGIEKLNERVFSPRVRDANGQSITLEIRGGGLYAFDMRNRPGPVELSYRVRLNRPLEPGQYALVSSIGPEAAILFAADLIPRITEESGAETPSAFEKVTIEAPDGWSAASLERSDGRTFEVSDASLATFVLGKIRKQANTAIAGTWEFDDDRVVQLSKTIAQRQAAMMNVTPPPDNFLIALAPFPLPLTGLRSAALARGRTVVLMLNQGNDALRTRAHFERHLAHEMFHFYLPNAFVIRDNFDWFWEGFSRYIGLLSLVEAGVIRVEDYLDVLLAEYDAYRVNPQRNSISLVSASPEKFASAANYEIVYRKGLLVAALYDLELRWQSRGKNRLSQVIGNLYRDYALTRREIGNREVLDALRRAGNFSQQIANDIEGANEIELLSRLEVYGIIMDRSIAQGRARLVPSPRLSDRQEQLIAQLKGM
jgi:hypothetical protein